LLGNLEPTERVWFLQMSIFSERELMVSNSVTLNDLERRNRPNGCVILLNSVAFWGDCVKVVEDMLYFLRQKCRPGQRM